MLLVITTAASEHQWFVQCCRRHSFPIVASTGGGAGNAECRWGISSASGDEDGKVPVEGSSPRTCQGLARINLVARPKYCFYQVYVACEAQCSQKQFSMDAVRHLRMKLGSWKHVGEYSMTQVRHVSDRVGP